jgi:hypothetical protein
MSSTKYGQWLVAFTQTWWIPGALSRGLAGMAPRVLSGERLGKTLFPTRLVKT